MLAVLILAFSILVGTAAASVTREGTSSLNNNGPHGLSEMTYAFTSATGNNGSAFAGLNANTKFYNIAFGVVMFFGRFLMIVPLMGIAGSLAAKKKIAESAGTFSGRRTAVHVPPHRRHRHRRCADVFPGSLARSLRGAFPHERRKVVLMPKQKGVSLFDRSILRRALIDSLVKLSRRRMMKNPVMFLVEARCGADHAAALARR